MDKDQLLLNYFEKNLSPEQEQQFNELLSIDPEFEQQFNFEKNLQQVIRNKKSDELKLKLIDFEKDLVAEIPIKKPKPNYSKWIMAASMALLLGLGWLGYQSFSGPNYASLYESNFKEYPNTVFAITRGETVASIERNAFAAYESGDYRTAMDNFKRIPKADRKAYFDFYMGLSQMGIDQTAAAKASFAATIASNPEFTPEAYWYLALIAIKEKNKEMAVKNLKTLTANYDFQKEKAIKLLQELE